MKNIFDKVNMSDVLHHMDISKTIAKHLCGEDYTHHHRQVIGVFVMIGGVALVKLTGLTEIFVIEFFGDIFGYTIHGIGAIPFISRMEVK